MTNRLEVSILAAPLAAIDRRALSEAWYCALRLAPQAAPAFTIPARPQHNGALPASTRSGALARTRSVPKRFSAPSPTPRKNAALRRREAAATTRPARGTRLAESIERAFAGPNGSPKRATFAIGRGDARVHVVLQTSGGRTTLLALCRPEIRGVVARALHQARIALAARGIGIEFCAIGGGGCS